jgi:hypothetical protein
MVTLLTTDGMQPKAAMTYINALEGLALVAFQAGHAGSIPVARSDTVARSDKPYPVDTWSSGLP